METVYVLVAKQGDISVYYMGWYVGEKPSVTTDFNRSAMFAEKSVADLACQKIGQDFVVEEHGY